MSDSSTDPRLANGRALQFVTPPPGLAPHQAFVLSAVDGADGLFALRAKDDVDVRLFVLDAAVWVPDYAPVLSDSQAAALALETAENVLLLVVANPGADGTTVNLMAPIVVNMLTDSAAQVILDGQEFPLRAELQTV